MQVAVLRRWNGADESTEFRTLHLFPDHTSVARVISRHPCDAGRKHQLESAHYASPPAQADGFFCISASQQPLWVFERQMAGSKVLASGSHICRSTLVILF